MSMLYGHNIDSYEKQYLQVAIVLSITIVIVEHSETVVTYIFRYLIFKINRSLILF